jgi:hypothetical protein
MTSPFKVNTRSQWATLNPALLAGEPGLESDSNNLKIGDGRSAWASLPYHGCPGYWGSFWDSTSQVAALADTAYAIKLRQTDASSRGIRIISNERITVDHAGVYSITFSIQFSNTDNSIHDTNVWLRKNDSGSSGDVPASDSRFSIIARRGGIDGNVIGTVNFVLPLVANDYIQLMWATSNVAAYIHAQAAQSSPFAHPSIPGIICTVVQVASA